MRVHFKVHSLVYKHGAAPRKTAVKGRSHHRQGISLSACLKTRIDFVRVSQTKGRLRAAFLFGSPKKRTRRGAVVNDSPGDCQSRGKALPAGKGVLLPLPKNPHSKECGFFYPSRRLGISSRRSRGYHQPLWDCISSRASVHLSCGLMIYNTSC